MTYICIPFSAVHRLVLHVIHMYIFFSSSPRCSTRHTYAYLFSRTPTCSTRHTYAYLFQPYADLFYTSYICIHFSRTLTCTARHTYAYLFQPVAEVKEGVAGLCERCVRCSYPQVFTVQQHVQMSVCVHPHPDTTARSDIM